MKAILSVQIAQKGISLSAVIRDALAAALSAVLAELVASGRVPSGDYGEASIDEPKNPEHGDYATNAAMVWSKVAGKNPRELGEWVASGLASQPGIAAAEVAGPGFVNLRLDRSWVSGFVSEAIALEDDPCPVKATNPLRINVEFVSVNPNGPITIGSGRGAAYGSTLANVLEAAGHQIHREYYINDGVNSEQMRLFAESVRAMALGEEVPAGGYKGDYVQAVADQYLAGADDDQQDAMADYLRAIDSVTQMMSDPSRREELKVFMETEFPKIQATSRRLQAGGPPLHERVPENFSQLSPEEKLATIKRLSPADPRDAMKNLSTVALQEIAQNLMLNAQRSDLQSFGVTFDTWFSEQSLHDSGVVQSAIDNLETHGAADREPFRTKLTLAKGGVVEDVVREPQTGDVEPVEEGEELPPPTPSLIPEDGHEGGGTLWLRSTLFGDDMDRVLQRRDGRLTYIASDVAYHEDKFNRPENADKLITVLGPDHHGYIARLHAVVAANLLSKSPSLVPAGRDEGGVRGGSPGDLAEWEQKLYGSIERRDQCRAAHEEAERRLEVLIFQLVRFMKEGKPAPMRKRDGNIYALIDLMREIGQKVKPEAPEAEQLEAGKDVARFFYLMRHHDTTFDFDLDLAEKQSDDNPVFYVQYAHARICSVLEKAQEAGFSIAAADGAETLEHPKEISLMKKVCDLPIEVRRCAEDYGVHRLTTYAIELARTFHHFYDACRVVQPDQPELTRSRIRLCLAARASLRSALKLVGVSAPEKMERAV